jgi:AraC family transcriptional regulator of adaptative response/methylated-DNA-[protein]-cysteine methyltransferase
LLGDGEQHEEQLRQLAALWPHAQLREDKARGKAVATQIFSSVASANKPLSLQVRGTNFQIQVWRALLNLAPAQLCSYSQLADSIGKAKAARAVGSAIAANPIAFLIPCHRVIQQSGQLGGYRWGLERKQAMLVREAALCTDLHTDLAE